MDRRIMSDSAITPVLSSLLAIAIMSSSITVVVSFGIPAISSQNNDKNYETSIMQFNIISSAIDNNVNQNIGDVKSIPFSDKDGKIVIDNEEFDRTVIFYSLNDNTDFSIRGLGDKDNAFSIYDCETAIKEKKIIFLNEDGSIPEEGDWIIDQSPELDVVIPENLGKNFEGEILIYLYDNNGLFGKILLIDSSPMNYFYNSDNQINFERSGVIYDYLQGKDIKKDSLIQINNNYIYVKLLQIRVLDYILYTGNTLNNIKLESIGNIIQQPLVQICSFGMQFYYGNSQDWIDYYSIIYPNFIKISSDGKNFDTLKYDAQPVWFSLFHSIIEIN